MVSQRPAALLAIPAAGSQSLSENVHESGLVLTAVFMALDRGHVVHLEERVTWITLITLITLDHFECCDFLVLLPLWL